MPVIGTNIAQSLAGAPLAEKSIAKPVKKDEGKAGRVRAKDELIVSAEGVESAEAVRATKGNDQEESHEDRREHANYSPDGMVGTPGTRPRLDIAG